MIYQKQRGEAGNCSGNTPWVPAQGSKLQENNRLLSVTLFVNIHLHGSLHSKDLGGTVLVDASYWPDDLLGLPVAGSTDWWSQ